MIDIMRVQELKERMDKGDELILVDCRETEEYHQGHIEGARLIPLSNFMEGSQVLSDKQATIVLQCRSGGRSLRAAQYLEEEGFEKLYNLEGGILAWQELGLPVATPSG